MNASDDPARMPEGAHLWINPDTGRPALVVATGRPLYLLIEGARGRYEYDLVADGLTRESGVRATYEAALTAAIGALAAWAGNDLVRATLAEAAGGQL